ncbi:MAG: ABC transporter ATP-binding protein [Polyangiaceae bacterium]|nr:ABC transporter ATP-binding protein [Polyangiaceae bacterium]MCL4755310.1 ABC transporter ATP-binding protein [Myxococcales bacterium]
MPGPSAGLIEPPAIRVRHLWHRYGSMDVLRDVSFEVGHGEIFGFIGPNGAGKTTTIRIMATLLDPMAGRVEIDGIDVSVDPDQVRRIIGYMPDHAGVYDRITVREYLEFFADAYRVANIGVVDAVIELTDLGNLQDRLVAALSKGMKQRLGLARILLHDPKILILDEPASDLDPRARIEIRDLLLELRELGKTIFLSSHILTELSDVCTSVGILERGKLVVAGPIGQIAERLEVQRAAEAVGLQPGATGAPAPVQAFVPAVPEPGPPPAGERAATGAPAPVITAGGAEIPSSTRKRLRLRVLGDSRVVLPLIAGGTGILSVEPGPGGQLTVYYVGNDRFVADVVRHLVANGVGIVGVEPERNELERIFLEVTRGDLQ